MQHNTLNAFCSFGEKKTFELGQYQSRGHNQMRTPLVVAEGHRCVTGGSLFELKSADSALFMAKLPAISSFAVYLECLVWIFRVFVYALLL